MVPLLQGAPYLPEAQRIPLLAYPIKNSSAPNGIVLDLFGGSGSTLMACEQTDSLLESGWRMDEIDRMDMPGFLKIRAWNAKREQEKKAPRQRYIDEVWAEMKPV